MSEKIVVKYCADSEYAKEPFEASADAAGYDLFVAQNMTLPPGSVTCIKTSLSMSIPRGYFGKIYPRSGLLKNHFISCDGGMIDADFRGIVAVLMTDNGSGFYAVRISDRIAQIALHKKLMLSFRKLTI